MGAGSGSVGLSLTIKISASLKGCFRRAALQLQVVGTD